MYQKISSTQLLPDEVADRIKALITGQHLKPGDKLPSEMELTRLFGVSRPTVREAIKFLMSHNILKIVRGKGTFVSMTPGILSDPFGLDFINDGDILLSLIEARLIIEPGVARLAAEKAEPGDVQRLAQCIEEMRGIVHEHGVGMESELAFHRGIAEATKNPVIERVVPTILASIVKTYKDSGRTSEDYRQALQEHVAVFEAIRDHDSAAACNAMKRHLERSFRRTLEKRSRAQVER